MNIRLLLREEAEVRLTRNIESHIDCYGGGGKGGSSPQVIDTPPPPAPPAEEPTMEEFTDEEEEAQQRSAITQGAKSLQIPLTTGTSKGTVGTG